MRSISPLLFIVSLASCQRREPPPPPIQVNRSGLLARLQAAAGAEEANPEDEATKPDGRPTNGESSAHTPEEELQRLSASPKEGPVVVERIWGRADLDPENNDVVAPPEAVPDCHDRLTELGVTFRSAELPLRQLVGDIPTCGAHDAVIVVSTRGGMKVSPPAIMTCQMALGMAALEDLLQEVAQRELGERVRSLHQGGTYSCRKMARFDLVSEHSYGNAIDVYSFTLESGRKISVLGHYGTLDADPATLGREARFLREVASSAFDRDLFSVSLSPYWDALHKDHFHFDMARYRVDGTRPR